MVTDDGSYFPEGANISSASTTNECSSSNNTRHFEDLPGSYGFPRLLTVQVCTGSAESYCRSLLLQGHGFPLWRPQVALNNNTPYLKKGVSIGDVGFIDNNGCFEFCFNIFLPFDHPINAGRTPREFQPLSPPLDPSEITFIPDYFKPGTIIAGEGIKVIKHGTSPLDASFSSKQREGGILILPHGASREDMTTTDRLHEYIQRNAPHWYQKINWYGNGVIHPNGSLIVVTGCDKTKEYASASFSNTDKENRKISGARYTWRPDFKIPWYRQGHATIQWYQPIPPGTAGVDIPIDDLTKNQCVFMRTLRISLSTPSWIRAMPMMQSSSSFNSFILEPQSIFQRCLDLIAIWPKSRDFEERLVRILHSPYKNIFEPNIVIAQILLGQFPKADVSLIDDAAWCLVARGGLGTSSNILNLVDRVLEQCEVIETDGRLTLLPKAVTEKSFMDYADVLLYCKRCLRLRQKPRVDIAYVCKRYHPDAKK